MERSPKIKIKNKPTFPARFWQYVGAKLKRGGGRGVPPVPPVRPDPLGAPWGSPEWWAAEGCVPGKYVRRWGQQRYVLHVLIIILDKQKLNNEKGAVASRLGGGTSPTPSQSSEKTLTEAEIAVSIGLILISMLLLSMGNYHEHEHEEHIYA